MVLGLKEKFAIDFEIKKRYCWEGTKYLVGQTQLYISGHRIGNWEDENIIGVFLTQLKGILNLEDNNKSTFKNISFEQIKTDFENRNNYSEIGLVPKFLGENFDDYFIVLYKQSGKLSFIWRYVDEPSKKYEDYSKDILIASVDLIYFEKVVNEFENVYNSEKQNMPPC